MFDIEHTDEFEEWWNDLSEKEQKDIAKDVKVLGQLGPALGRPRVDSIKKSTFSNIKELRTQSGGNPIRTFFAFDPRRSAILLIGGDKTGDNKFYDKMIPMADKLYLEHLKELGNG
jgi:hypothetical protein